MTEIDRTPESTKPALSAPVPLTPDRDLSAFDCGEPALNDRLRHRALKNESRFWRTYVVCAGNAVVGYFCVSAGSVERGIVPDRMPRNAPDRIPVSAVGRLAVSRNHAGKGLGANLLADALGRIASASHIIGVGAVLVQAKDDAARRFYADLIEYPADSRSPFLPIETLLASFA